MTRRLFDLTEAQVAERNAKVRAARQPMNVDAELRSLGVPIDALPKKRSKYGNEVQIVDGIRMASKREAKRYRELGLLLKAGEIDFLARQVRFRLPGGIEYVADFLYGTIVPCDLICEDAKGVKTPEYKLKKKLMLSEHGIIIAEV